MVSFGWCVLKDASDGGWCFYSDVTLAIRKLREASAQRVQKFMIIDTDVHQVGGSAKVVNCV